MPYNESLAERVREVLGQRRLITEKHMFGGKAFLLAGNMCVAVWNDYLILRIGVDLAEHWLSQPNVLPFDLTGKPMRGWVMIEPEATLHAPQVEKLCSIALGFVKTLPAK